ncbi:hypothetical protein ACWC9T_40920, partial [Kitasatospora sp. NPDC001159]
MSSVTEALADHFIADPSLLPALTGLQDRDDGTIRHELVTLRLPETSSGLVRPHVGTHGGGRRAGRSGVCR